MFRYFLLNGHCIQVNDSPILPIDPLFIAAGARYHGATLYGEPLIYDISVPGRRRNSRIEVRFAELPIEQWHALSNDDKRRMGIVKGAGVSIVRAGREIDSGWLFMPGKRRENYDDWWRCEIRFDPDLDELFGVTYTKQGVHPTDLLQSLLSPEIETVARKLNANVRRRFIGAKAENATSASEAAANRYGRYLRPVPTSSGDLSARSRLAKLGLRTPSKQYSIIVRDVRDPSFFIPLSTKGKVVAVINKAHPFYECVYEPLVGTSGELAEVRKAFDLLLLAAARTEACASRHSMRERSRMRIEWGQTLATFLGK
jgi:hypothetical protein